jgi:glutathione S-transferase
MIAMPAELLSAAVAVLAVLFIYVTVFNVGRVRGQTKINAPAVTGHPKLEAAVRVQMNTVEQAIVFFPLLYLATAYFHVLAWLPAVFGLVWILGRFLYMQGYMADPGKRSTGFLVTLVATLGLLILSIWGIVQAWIAVHAV